MGEARRRKLVGNTTPKGSKWKQYKPSRFVKMLVVMDPGRKQQRAEHKRHRKMMSRKALVSRLIEEKQLLRNRRA